MQCHRKFDDAEIRGQVTTVYRTDRDQAIADFLSQYVDIRPGEAREVGGGPESFEEHGHPFNAAKAEPMQRTAPLPPPIPLRPRTRVWIELARFVSTVCNPFLTSLALFALLAWVEAKTTASFWVFLGASTFFTTLAPLAFVFWLYASGRISDLDMSIRAEREKVFVIFVVCFVLGTITLWLLGAPSILTASMAGYAISSLVVQWITRYWKISTHALGITAPLVALWALYGSRPLPFFVLIPIVGWARVYLRAHTLLQVLAGTALAAISTFVTFRLFHIL
jgi:membrane-associated phospholipid phosphatase